MERDGEKSTMTMTLEKKEGRNWWNTVLVVDIEIDTQKVEPENSKLEWALTILTTIGVIALLAPGLIVWNNFVTVPKGAYEIEVVGQQWLWMYRLPGKDGILGTSDIKNINDDNPFGLNTDDPYSLDDILIDADDLHILKDQPLKLNLRALDVLHDFYVPQFRAKMDLVPGQQSNLWFEPTVLGTYEVACAEYCGTGHYAMRGTVVVDTQEDFNKWLAEQPTFAETMNEGANGEQIVQTLGCVACHSIDGSDGIGPTWRDTYGTNRALASGEMAVIDDDYIKTSIVNPMSQIAEGYAPVMPAYATLSDEELTAITDYIKTLSE